VFNVAWNKAGLALAARFGVDGALFRLAGQLKQVRPWKNLIPPACA
jgi:amidase/6-aminohexanoate-cyclic-dimer hydrolase